MAAEAKVKLTVDTSQAQKDIKLIDQESKSIGGKTSRGKSSSKDSNSDESLINSQKKFIKSFENYTNKSLQANERLVKRLESLESAINKQNSKKPESNSKTQTQTTPTDNDSSSSTIGKIAKAVIAAGVVNRFANFANQAGKSSKTSEQMTYDLYNTLGTYDGGRNSFSSGRNSVASMGSRYGYDTYATLDMQSNLIGMTGAGSGTSIQDDTQSALKSSRALSVDQNQLTRTFGGLYQSGTYGNGEMNKFANTFAASIKESGMTGREDEQLDILQDIADNLDQNLTTISESQYNNALGLYSMFSNSSQSMSGQEAADVANGLNTAITGGDNTMDVILGKYTSGDSLWKYEQRKEQGISNPENLSQMLKYYSGIADLDTDIGKLTMMKSLNASGANLSTEDIEEIVKHKDEIMNGTYTLDSSSGQSIIDKEASDYESSKLSDMNTYEAESLNAQERIGDDVNKIKSKLEDVYNNLPQGAQTATTGVGGAIGGATSFLTGVAGTKFLEGLFGAGSSGGGGGGLGSIFSKLFGAGGGSGTGGGLLSGIGKTVGGTASSLWSSASGVASNFFANGGGEFSAALGAYAPAIPDFLNIMKSEVSGKSEFDKLSDDDKALKWFSGEDSTYSMFGGRGGNPYEFQTTDEFLKDIQSKTSSGSKDWISSWVDENYQTGSDGSLVAKKGNQIRELLDAAGVTSFADSSNWSSKDDVRRALGNLSDADIKSIQGLKDESTGDYYMPNYVNSDKTIDDDTLNNLKSKLLETYSQNKDSEYLDQDLGATLWTTLGNGNGGKGLSLKETEDAMKQLFGEDYSRDQAKWWRANDADNQDFDASDISLFTGKGSNFDEVFKKWASDADSDNTKATEKLTDSIDTLNETLGGDSSDKSLIEKSQDSTSGVTIRNSTSSSSDSTTNSKSASGGGLWSKVKSFFGFGSNAVGNDYVPYDGYISQLHKGEMILDKNSAKNYRSGNSSSGTGSSHLLEIKLSGGIDGMTSENQGQITNAVVQQVLSQLGNNAMLEQLSNNMIRVN